MLWEADDGSGGGDLEKALDAKVEKEEKRERQPPSRRVRQKGSTCFLALLLSYIQSN